MPEISLIVPVYKVEKYLPRCLESVINQKFRDFEAILIDDGSPDKSGEICDYYAKQDDRFKVIHQKNKGVSAARNAGLKAASGKYIAFLDSDDEVDPEYLHRFLSYDETIDLVICDIVNHGVKGEVLRRRTTKQATLILSKDAILELAKGHAIDYVYSKRFSRRIIKENGIFFDEDMTLSEDTLFSCQYLLKCKKIQCLDEAYYHYYNYNEVRLSSVNDEWVEKLENANEKVLGVLEKQFPCIGITDIWIKRRFSYYYYYYIFDTLRGDIPKREKIKKLKKIFRMKQFDEFRPKLDYLMETDRAEWRWLLNTKNATLVVLAWSLYENLHGVRIKNAK